MTRPDGDGMTGACWCAFSQIHFLTLRSKREALKLVALCTIAKRFESGV
jgi:hypothetical protein